MNIKVPDEEEWRAWSNDPDVSFAHKVFAGKTNDQVQKDFRRNVIERSDELRFMPKKPFQYYVLGFKQFIDSGTCERHWLPDAASCFIGLIHEKALDQYEFIAPVIEDLLETARFITCNQEELGANKNIYSNFNEKLKEILQCKESFEKK